MRRSDIEVHYRDPRALYKHIRAMHKAHTLVLKDQRELRSLVQEKEKLSKTTTVASKDDIERLEREVGVSGARLENQLLVLEQRLDKLGALKYNVEAASNELPKLREALRVQDRKLEEQAEKLQQIQGQVVAVKGRPSSSTARHESYSDSRIMVVEKRLDDLERQNTMLKVHVSELELQLQASLASTHNGSFLWRIPDVARRRKDAIDERITSIYSPPFYTGRNGYKMCIRAYLNGDGLGFKSYLSLFFVLMRGEYDPLLKWPFEHKVSLILVDQEHRKHIVQTFKPTPESSSFKRPTSDMNVASGCPQFAKVHVLEEKNYVKEDIMYIKCIVDVSRIFHP